MKHEKGWAMGFKYIDQLYCQMYNAQLYAKMYCHMYNAKEKAINESASN